jgi:hypothetical protein
MKKIFLLLLVLAINTVTKAQCDLIIIPEANLILQLPLESWTLEEINEVNIKGYIFKRTPLTDSMGRNIIPAIMIFVEDASMYDGNIIAYSASKRQAFRNYRININKVMSHNMEDYPLSIGNSIIYESRYVLDEIEHFFIMAHIITRTNMGVQMYLDMTSEIAQEFGHEFWQVLKTVSEF